MHIQVWLTASHPKTPTPNATVASVCPRTAQTRPGYMALAGRQQCLDESAQHPLAVVGTPATNIAMVIATMPGTYPIIRSPAKTLMPIIAKDEKMENMPKPVQACSEHFSGQHQGFGW